MSYAYDQIAERILQGEAVDLDAILSEHPELTEKERSRLRKLVQLFPLELIQPPSRTPRTLGDYELIRKLGQGGMGIVYLAHQRSLDREVALKIIRPERTGSAPAQARFLREAQAIARLKHPHIVTVYDYGEEGETAYLAMEFVHGRGLDEVLRSYGERNEALPVKQSLQWGLQIAEALTAAHEHGVIHRDVKPSNILITPDRGALLVDFGLARDTKAASLTADGEFRGSPYYASPEQVNFNRGGIDARTDIYSLGATLYECLAGIVPFQGETTEQIFLQILQYEPEGLRKRRPWIPRECETVVLKALEKAKQRRYPDASGFASDLQALLENRPVAARPATWWLKSRKFVQRNPAASIAIALGLLLICGIPTSVIWQQSRTVQKIRAEQKISESMRLAAESSLAQEQNPALALLLGLEADDLNSNSLTRTAVYEAFDRCYERNSQFAPVSAFGIAVSPDGKFLATGHTDGSLWLRETDSGKPLQMLEGHDASVTLCQFDKDSRTLWTADDGFTMRRWDVLERKQTAVFTGHQLRIFYMIHIPEQKKLISGSRDGRIILWDSQSGARLDVLFENERGRCDLYARSPENNRLLLRIGRKECMRFDPENGERTFLQWPFDDEFVYPLESRDLHKIVSFNRKGEVWLGDLQTGKKQFALPTAGGIIREAQYLEDQEQIFLSAEDGSLTLWDLSNAKALQVMQEETGHFRFLRRSPDGSRYLAVSAGAKGAKIYSAATANLEAELLGHQEILWDAVWHPRKPLILSIGNDASVRVWDLDAPRASQVYSNIPGWGFRAWNESTKPLFSTVNQETNLQIRHYEKGKVVHELKGHKFKPSTMLILPDGDRAISSSIQDGLTILWDLSRSHPVQNWIGSRHATVPYEFSPSTQTLLLCLPDQILEVDPQTGTTQKKFGPWLSEEPVMWARYVDHDKKIAVGLRKDTAILFDRESRRQIRSIKPKTSILKPYAVSPAGEYLALCDSRTGQLEIYSMSNGLLVLETTLHSNWIWSMQFDPTGKTLLIGYGNGKIGFVDMDRPGHEEIMAGHEARVSAFALSPDGKYLASGSGNGEVKIWDYATRQEYLLFRGQQRKEVLEVGFNKENFFLTSYSLDGILSIRDWKDIVLRAQARRPRELTESERLRHRIELSRTGQ